MRVRWAIAGCVGVLASVASCTDVCGCTPIAPAVAVVTGEVTEEGQPVAGALVHAFSAAGGGCHSLDLELGAAVAGADGGYILELVSGSEQDDACVYVYARPAGAADGSQDSDTALVVVDLSYESVPDTVRIDLEPRGS